MAFGQNVLLQLGDDAYLTEKQREGAAVLVIVETAGARFIADELTATGNVQDSSHGLDVEAAVPVLGEVAGGATVDEPAGVDLGGGGQVIAQGKDAMLCGDRLLEYMTLAPSPLL